MQLLVSEWRGGRGGGEKLSLKALSNKQEREGGFWLCDKAHVVHEGPMFSSWHHQVGLGKAF